MDEEGSGYATASFVLCAYFPRCYVVQQMAEEKLVCSQGHSTLESPKWTLGIFLLLVTFIKGGVNNPEA